MASTFPIRCRQMLYAALAAFFVLTPGPGVWAQSAPSAMPPSVTSSRILAASPAVQAPDATEGLDTRLFRQVNNAQSEFKTSLFHITDNSVAVLVVGVPVGCIVYGLAADNREILTTGVLLSASEVLTYGLKYVLKETFKRPRPYEQLPDVIVHDIESADQYSFPSGHASGAFSLATMLALRHPKPAVYIPAFLWAGLVSYGRVYNGVHYPADVLGGAVLGAGSSVLTYALRGTVMDVFDKVTGRSSDPESSVSIVPQSGGATLMMSMRF